MPSRQQNPHKMNPTFSKYAGIMAKFSLIKEVALDIYKETGRELLRKWMQIITEFIQAVTFGVGGCESWYTLS